MPIRLCYFDVDETLVEPDRSFRPSLLDSLARCRDRGIGLGLATGRMLEAARPYAQRIATNAPLILYNGARVVDLASEYVLYSRTLALEPAARALRLAGAQGLHVNLYLDDHIYIDRETEISQQSAAKDGVVQIAVGNLSAFLEREPTKLLIIGPGEKLEALERGFRAEPSSASLVRSEPTYLEILPAGASKGAALEEVSRQTGVPLGEIAAFGDSNNDIEMIQSAGLGVAVANALDALKAVADCVSTAPRGAGVDEILRARVLKEA